MHCHFIQDLRGADHLPLLARIHHHHLLPEGQGALQDDPGGQGWADVQGLEENGVGTLLRRGVAVNHLLREGSFSPGLTGFSTYNMNPTEEVLGEGRGLP